MPEEYETTWVPTDGVVVEPIPIIGADTVLGSWYQNGFVVTLAPCCIEAQLNPVGEEALLIATS